MKNLRIFQKKRKNNKSWGFNVYFSLQTYYTKSKENEFSKAFAT
jgi:hypothetical protein